MSRKKEKMTHRKQEKTRVRNNLLAIGILFMIFVLSASLSQAQVYNFASSSSSASISNIQYFQPGIRTYYSSSQISQYWPILSNKDQCRASTDLMIQIAPGGCTPAVVRSDLLEEQDVPVFCRLQSVKLNPSIDVTRINSIIPSLVQDTVNPKNSIAGVGFHPARAALRTTGKLLGSPVVNDIGYAVVVLKRHEIEKNMSEWVEANMTARIRYNTEKAFGIGKAEMYLPEMADEEWNRDYVSSSFWSGKGYLRADWIEPNRAEISVYIDKDTKVSSIVLEKGKKTEDTLYLPSTDRNDYCRRGLEITLQDIAYPALRAVIVVDDNDKIELSRGASFLDGNCHVDSIKNYGDGTGEARIRCPRESFTIKLGMKQVKLDIDGVEKGYSAGDEVASDAATGKKLYLAYTGKFPKTMKVNGMEIADESERVFAVLADSAKSKSEIDKLVSSIATKVSGLAKSEEDYNDFNTKVESAVREVLNEIDSMTFILLNRDNDNVMRYGDKEIYLKGLIASEDKDYSSEGDGGLKFEDYFKKTIQAYREVATQYPAEYKDETQKITYGEIALQDAINLAEESQKYKTARELRREIIEKYPDSTSAKSAKEIISNSEFYDERNASHFTTIDFETRQIRLVEIKEPGIDEANAEMTVKDTASGSIKPGKYGIGEYVFENPGRDCSTSGSKELKIDEFINLTKIEEDKITITATYCDKELKTKDNTQYYEYSSQRKTFVINNKESKTIGDYEVSVDSINLKRVAHVLLNPKTSGDEIQSNFSFKIGIEKRAIQLSPEKTASMIEKLNETIEKWQKLNKKIGSAVEGMKGACFATSAVLTIKNLFSGFGGESVARQKVMRNSGGWVEQCTVWLKTPPAGKSYANLDDCLLKNADAIDADVKVMTAKIQKQNEDIKKIESSADVTQSTFFGKNVNTEKSAEKYIDGLKSALETAGEITLRDENNKEVEIDLGGIVKKLDWTAGDAGYDQLRAIELYSSMIKPDSGASRTAREMAQKELYSTLRNIQDRQNSRTASADLSSKWKIPFRVYSDKDAFVEIYENGVLNDDLINAKIKGIVGQTPVQGIVYENTKYVAVLSPSSGKQYSVSDFYELNAQGSYDKVDDTTRKMLNKKFSSFEKFDETKYQNPYKDAQVRFYETEPYKGMPAVVPLDTQNGWYAATKQTLPAFGNVKPFEESGKVSSFWLCNVGANGLEQFSQGLGAGDDICGMFNLNTGQPLDEFAGLSKEKTKELVGKAIQSLREAASQYPSKTIRVPAGIFQTGKPATSSIGTQCQDFMSPKDCWVMFNVCDPVVCPASRCNLGGAYPVDDVIQSGIVGSIALCLPNIREKIFIPVCLTGIHAGIEGWVSILKARRDCLQESLSTGRTIGICDQIHSIYACDFWWRQFAPFLNIIPKKITELMYGQGTRGGGEYMTVNEAWSNAEKSWQYFTTFYAANSKMSFAARSFADIGTEVCKMGISTKYPQGFKAMFEPESPPQIHAWFDEITYTEATYPATSQYKVYYHVFAGQDNGAYYSIYLKTAAATSYYQSIPFITVDSGFIPAGETIDITKDFTAPAGYKELCVRINAKDYCGFKQVSTSFALNYVKDKYLGEQASQQVTSEKQCISGTPSLYSLAQPNLQAGAEEALSPEIYNRGIIRICASKDPGETTDVGRWKDVGYCDDQNIRCWLDKDSVENNIRNKDILNKTLGEVEQTNMDNLIGQGYYDEKEGKAGLDAINKRLEQLKRGIEKFSIDADLFISMKKEETEKLTITVKAIEDKERITGSLSSIINEAGTLINDINLLNEKLIFTYQKVNALYLKAQVYGEMAKAYIKAVGIVVVEKWVEEMKKLAEKGVLVKGVWSKDTSISYEVESTNIQWIIKWQDAQGNSIGETQIGKDLGKNELKKAIDEGPYTSMPKEAKTGGETKTETNTEGIFTVDENDNKIYYNDLYTNLYLEENGEEYTIMQEGFGEVGFITKSNGEILSEAGMERAEYMPLLKNYVFDEEDRTFTLKSELEEQKTGEMNKKEAIGIAPTVRNAVVTYTSEHEDVIATVCGVLGFSGLTTSVAAKFGIGALEKAPTALAKAGTPVIAEAGGARVAIENINGVSYATKVGSGSGRILGQVGNGMKIFKIPEAIAVTITDASGGLMVASSAMGTGVVEGLSLGSSATIVAANTGEVLGEGTLIFSKAGGLKFVSNALLKAAPVLQKVSLVLAPVTVASALCDVGTLIVTIVSVSDSLKVMDESAKAADKQMGLLVRSVGKKLLDINQHLSVIETGLSDIKDNYPDDYEPLNVIFLEIKNSFDFAREGSNELNDKYYEYLYNDDREEIGFVNSVISGVKSGWGLWGTPETGSKITDEEHRKLINLEVGIREKLVEIVESADNLSEKLGALMSIT